MTETHDGTRDPEQIREEIEATRHQLGDTVEALAHKADVKAQASEKVQATKATVAAKKDELLGKAKQASPDGASSMAGQVSEQVRRNPAPVAVMGAFALGVAAGRVLKR